MVERRADPARLSGDGLTMPFLLKRNWLGTPEYSIYFGDVPRIDAKRGEQAIPVTDRQARMGLDTLVQFHEQGCLAR